MSIGLLDGFALSELSSRQLDSLVTLRVEEDERLDYKLLLKLDNDRDKRELCKDVSALSNTRGGYILVGIREDHHARAASIVGIEIEGGFHERLLQIATSGISPRVQRLEIRTIEIGGGRAVVVIKVGTDGQLRQVKYADDRYYKRFGRITVAMEPADLSVFFQSSSVSNREDLIEVARNGFEDSLQSGSFHGFSEQRGILSLCIQSSTESRTVDLVEKRYDVPLGLVPIDASGWNHRLRGASIITFSQYTREDSPYTLAEITNEGLIRAANASLLDSTNMEAAGLPRNATGYIPSIAYEREVILATRRYLDLLAKLSVSPPWHIGLSMLKVRGYVMSASRRMRRPSGDFVFDRDKIVCPDVVVGDAGERSSDLSVARILRPAFDFVWREMGFQRSFNYTPSGDWTENQQ